MNVTGLIRLRSAEAKGWNPLLPHYRAELARVDRVIRSMLLTAARILRPRVSTYPCLACNLMTRGLGTRNTVSARYHKELDLALVKAGGTKPVRIGWLCQMAELVHAADFHARKTTTTPLR